MKQERLFDDWGLAVTSKGTPISALDVHALIAQVRRHDFVLLRKFDVSEDGFVEFSDRFSRWFMKHAFARLRPRVGANPTVSEVLTGTQRILVHRELAYVPFTPDLLFLHCVQPAAEGGETTLCNGRSLWKELSPALRRLFEDRRLRYEHRWSREIWQSFLGTTDAAEALRAIRQRPGVVDARMDEDESLWYVFLTPALVRTAGDEPAFSNSLLNVKQYETQVDIQLSLEDGTRIPDEVCQELDARAEAICYPVPWQPSDVLIIDNRATMHGRRAFTGPRRILSRFCHLQG
jgi:alpha-ketoglutarate-dependent taurine dioxygenase